MTVMLPKPETIPIGGRPYSVKLEKDLGIRRGADGLHSPQTLELILDQKPIHLLITEALCHEWMEGVNITYFDGELDHSTIDRIGQAALQFLTGLGIEIDWGAG